MFKRGLPTEVKMRHDSHYVEELTRGFRSIGKILPIDQLAPNPEQPRTEIGDLTELTDSIKQNGVLEPILVKPLSNETWMIIAGERRWRASSLAGLTEVPCIELDLDAQSIAEIALIENLQRKDLTVWEEADGLAFLADRFKYTHDEIAKKIGKSRTTVTESMAIAGLPESIREKCRQKQISAKSTLLELARQFDEKAMHQFFDSLEKVNFRREKSNPNSKRILTKKNTEFLPTEKISASKISNINETKFVFSSNDNNFELEIRFKEKSSFEKSDVLQALKEVFDTLKRNPDTN